ncbi:EF-hand domain-containing protein [Halovulum sp. GXIMD14794]
MKTYRSILAVTASALVIATAGFALAQDRDGPRGGGERMAHAAQDGGHHGGHRGGKGMRGDRGAMMMERFAEQFDTNGDGDITQDEIDAARAAQLAEFDADGDGSLNLQEYEALWLDAMRERMVDRFQAHDDDGDGAVTVEEFGEEFTNIVERRDRNGDGVLNADDMQRRGPMNRGVQAAPAE